VPSTDKRPAASLPPCAAALACALVLASAGCGKKGPPLPPLVKLPAAPGDLSAERHGDDVTVRFTVPAANTDNTKPANVERVDVYAFTGPTSTSDDDVFGILRLEAHRARRLRRRASRVRDELRLPRRRLRVLGSRRPSSGQLEQSIEALLHTGSVGINCCESSAS